MALTPDRKTDARPWWKFGYMWLVVGGPTVVVIASFITLWLAIRTPDPVISEDYYQRGININKTLESPEKSLVPAMKGRNHAATPQTSPPH